MTENDLRLSREHEWVRLTKEGDVSLAVVGISNFAQEQLNDIVSVELPRRGTKVKQMQTIAIIDSVKASSDIYSPLSGEIVETNESLLDHPEWINQSPYELGWIVKIKPHDLSREIESLMSQREYDEFVGTK
jgi:glycine cleavage system H protein